MYPTRDEHCKKATLQRLQNDRRKNVYGNRANSILVKHSYPELNDDPHSHHHHNNNNTNSITNKNHRNHINQNCWSEINIDQYQILKKVGSGTYGSVFHARSPTGGNVAIKQLSSMHNEKQLDGFHITAIREIKILKALNHTNIITLHDVLCCKENVMSEHGKNHGSSIKKCDRMQTYMIFEYMDHDLSGLLHNESVSFDISHIKYFLFQILNALQYCHETALILHRDIKSSNLLVDNQGVVKIADFGLARQFIPKLRASEKQIASNHESVNNSVINHARHYTNRVVTLWYRAPELLLSDVHYTPSVDLWSVGCVFAELLCGKPIFQGKNEMEQWFQIIDICGWNWKNNKENEWMHNLRDKDGLISAMKKKSKTFKRKLRMKFNAFLKNTPLNKKYLDENGFNLLDKLLTLNPNKRLTAKQARQSQWFRCAPFAKPPNLNHIPPSHDYEQRQQRKNQNYRNHPHPHHHRNHNNNYNQHPHPHPQQHQSRRYAYQYNAANNNNTNNNNNNTNRNKSRSRSRSRSRERDRVNNNNKNNVLLDNRSRSGSTDKITKIPPPIPHRPSIHQQKMVVQIQPPSLNNRLKNSNNTNNAANGIKNGYKHQWRPQSFNPDEPQTFYSRFKKEDKLKNRSRF